MDTLTDLPHTAKILFRTGAARGKVLLLQKDRVSFGRDADNDVTIADNIVSSHHAVLTRNKEGEYWLEDLDSKNGTFLDSERISRVQLKDGDVFCICKEGPEAQFVLGVPRLPSLLETSTATFRRTRSFGQAVRELMPHDRGGQQLVSCGEVAGVREVLDYRLKESSRRSRVQVVVACGVFFLLSIVSICVTVYLLRRPESGGDQTRSVAASRNVDVPRAEVGVTADLQALYGSLFLSYREQPIGTATVTNRGREPLQGVGLHFAFDGEAAPFLIEPYSVALGVLEPGASLTVDVAPKLSNLMLSEYTREVTARLSLRDAKGVLAESSQAIFVYGRQVFNWDDPERVAAFIDPDDPAVSRLVKKAWMHRPPSGSAEFPPANFVAALTLLTALAEQGLRYRPDAQNPISARMDWKANDRVAYPSGTLLARSGDCDDLSVLCCSLLESGGIPTAFAVGSSHVFFLFDTGLPMSHLENSALEPRTVVPWKGRVWAPVEATELAGPGATFAAAWAAAWSRREAVLAGEFQLIDVQEAWGRYQPLSPPPTRDVEEDIRRHITVPDGLGKRLTGELEALRRLFRDSLRTRVREIEAEGGDVTSTRHGVGLLYAQSGLFADARRILQSVVFEGIEETATIEQRLTKLRERGLEEQDSVALLHLAIVATLDGNAGGVPPPEAVAFAAAAVDGFPPEAVDERGEALLRLALVHRLRGDLAQERTTLERAIALRPGLEETYRALVTSDGRVAGPLGKFRRFLREALR